MPTNPESRAERISAERVEAIRQFIEQERARFENAAKSRRESAAHWRHGTDEEWAEGAKLAARMEGRRFSRDMVPTAYERELDAQRDDCIGAKNEQAAACCADVLSVLAEIDQLRADLAAREQERIELTLRADLFREQAESARERAEAAEAALAAAQQLKESYEQSYVKALDVIGARETELKEAEAQLSVLRGELAQAKADWRAENNRHTETIKELAELSAARTRLREALAGVRSTARGYPCWCDASHNSVEHGHQPKCEAATAALSVESKEPRCEGNAHVFLPPDGHGGRCACGHYHGIQPAESQETT